MSKYRKISLSMHADKKYRELSSPQPNGKSLWVHLLVGPHTGPIPGLSTVGELSLAEATGWSLKDFRRAFAEIQKRDMAVADWESRVVWIPKAITYNPPESPNVVTSWAKVWDEIPECELKTRAFAEIKAFIDEMPDGFKKAFRKAFAKVLRKDYGEGTARGRSETQGEPSSNQEQEQEQEQEHTPKPPEGASAGGDGKSSSRNGTPSVNASDTPLRKMLDEYEVGDWEFAGIVAPLQKWEFYEAAAKFLKHLREKDRYPTPTSWRGQMGDFAAMGLARSLAALRYSTNRGYLSVCEDRGLNGHANGPPPGPRQSIRKTVKFGET